MKENAPPPNLQIFYDDSCPVCSTFIGSINGTSQKKNFTCTGLSKNDSPKSMLSKEFHVITPEGTVYRKFEGILKVAEQYRKLKILVLLARLPIIHACLSLGYDIFAAHRYGISQYLTRTIITKQILILFMAFGLLLSEKLWVSTRYYPQVPVFPFIPITSFPFDYSIYLTALALLLVSLFRINKRLPVFLFLLLAAFLALSDQSRWQPWFFQYFMMLTALIIYPFHKHKEKRELALTMCCFIIASIYIYSGLQKMNSIFPSQIFPWMIQPLTNLAPSINSFLFASGYSIPLFETSIGIGLLIQRLRLPAIIAAVGMHLSILGILGPWGHSWNSVVWPWNIAMCLLVVTLFFANTSLRLSQIFSFKNKLIIAITFLFGVLPAFSFADLWDSYLSASLYSGNTKSAGITINHEDLQKAPYLRNFATATKEGGFIDLNSWSFSELNVPAYPEKRIFKGIAKSLCNTLNNSPAIQLHINNKPHWISGVSTTEVYSCMQL